MRKNQIKINFIFLKLFLKLLFFNTSIFFNILYTKVLTYVYLKIIDFNFVKFII